MTGPSLLTAAVEELYAAPLAEFIARRKTLAAAAKQAGDRVAATAIGALRKPSLSADTVNRLVRGAPDEMAELLQLGADLRGAEQALDAGELRRLGDRRRRLVGDLAELAFELTGQRSPSAAVRDEVTATLNAALADEQVAQRLSSGALVTQARWDGFGSTQLPELAASMPDLPPPRSRPDRSAPKPERPVERESDTPVPRATPPKRNDKSTAAQQQAAARRSTDQQAEQQAEQERAGQRAEQQRAGDRREAAKRAEQQRAAAQQAAARQAAAQEAAEAAAAAAARAAEAQELVSVIDRRISELNLQLAHQRRLLADAQRALKAAENDRKATALAATRAGAGGR